MTSYIIYAPISIFSFLNENNVVYKAWSPRRYGPIYTYDIVIEIENQSHPMMNNEYFYFIRNIFDHLDMDHETIHQTSMTHYGTFLHFYTDFYSDITVEHRGDHLYFIILHNHIFSPIFFNYDDAMTFLNKQRNYFPLLSNDFQLQVVEHELI
jgi:hypothetical protein